MSTLAVEPRVAPKVSAAPSALHPFSKVVAFFAWVLLFAGGMVTSTGSSLAVPDWPLSFGQVLPPMVGGVAFEHGHRVIAGIVALLTWGLTFWLRSAEPRAWVRRLAYTASGLILLQAVLGGVTVLLRLPPAVSISHACLGQLVFCLLAAVAQATSPWFKTAPEGSSGALWKAGAVAFVALYLQLAMGALLRHTGRGVMAHMAWAIVAACAAWTASTRGVSQKDSDRLGLTGPSQLLGLLMLVQLALGYVAYKLRFAPDFSLSFTNASLVITGHLAVGALLLGTTTVFFLRAHRAR